MAKGKKKGLADKVRNKKKNIAKAGQIQSNPFEVKINKVKHTVVNKKVQKWEKGTPGVSRSKAVKKRQDTLLRELHHMKKSNSLHDKRFGETDSNMTADEKMVQRFALEKKKQMQKGDFSLKDEEETLTHYGQSLAENLQDTIGSDSEEEGAPRTGDLQFGGFAKPGEEVSWKDKMREVIADSKQHKYERQMEKEKALETTNELDTKWKDVMYDPLKQFKGARRPLTSYLQLVHNFVLEQKSAGGTDKLKTEEEKAKEEAEQLQLLEAKRLSRMAGSDDSTTKSDHVSADGLADSFALDDPVPKGKSKKEKRKQDADSDEDDDDDDDENDEQAGESGQEKDGESKGEVEEEGDDDDDDGDEDVEDGDDGDNDSDGDEEEDGYSDLESDKESDEEQDSTGPPADSVKKPQSTKKSTAMSRKLDSVKASDLPFVFAAPGSYEELEALLHGHGSEEQTVILSRLRKCHHPSLAEGNKEKLEAIHLYLLQYFGKLVQQTTPDWTLINHVTVSLWEMTQQFKQTTAVALQKYITQREEDFATLLEKRKGRGLFPKIDTLMHLSLIDTLFPTSDFRHPVCTPALHFITQMLAECPVKSSPDLMTGLLLCAQALKFVSLSKRYLPEVVCFLHGILSSCAQKKDRHATSLGHSSRMVGLLSLDHKSAPDTSITQWSISQMMSAEDQAFFDSDQFKCECLSVCVDLICQCLDLWQELPCLNLVTEPIRGAAEGINKENYPASLKVKLEGLDEKLKACADGKVKVMQQASSKPEPLRLFEPKIEEFWSGKRKKGGPNRQANEKQRLTHKFKREMKAAVREIKRDNEVLAKHQLDQVMKKDQERKRKMKELMHGLASQEGDYKAIKRMKKD